MNAKKLTCFEDMEVVTQISKAQQMYFAKLDHQKYY